MVELCLVQLLPFFPQVSLGEFELKAPVTIRLKAGTGPVTVSGLHLIGNILVQQNPLRAFV